MENNIFVFTDLEPDDYLALWILAKRNYDIYGVVVGEGQDVKEKVKRAKHYFSNKNIFANMPRIIQGDSSTKDFPENFGYECENECNYNLKDELQNYINNGGSKIVIIKPPRELFNMMRANLEEMKKLLENATCYIYGSFNMRSIDATSTEFEQFNGLFKNIFLYESYFATSRENNLNCENFPLMTILLKNNDFGTLLYKWDSYIIKDCVDTCNDLLHMYNLTELVEPSALEEIMSKNDLDKYKRNFKCYIQVKSNLGRQCVFADCGLAVAMDKPYLYKRGTICFNSKSNTNVNFDESGKHNICVSNFNTITKEINDLFINDPFINGSLI